MARVITYTVECPTCLTAGVRRFLGLDPAIGILCDAETPHIFETLPGSSAAPERNNLAQEAKPEGAQQAESVGSGESDSARFSELVKGRAQPAADSPQATISEVGSWEGEPEAELIPPTMTPEQQERLDTILAGGQRAAARRDDVKESNAQWREEGGQVVESSVMVGDGMSFRLPNGDVLFGLRISEQWAETIRAHAETQNQTFAEYLQDYINNVALLNEWANAPTPK